MNATKTETSLVLKAQAGDPEARGQVVSEMDSMVGWVLNVVSWRGGREDGMQEGRIGVLKAIQKFDADRGAQFSTYAFWHIRKAMERAMQHADIPQEEIRKSAPIPAFDEAELGEVRELVEGLSDHDRELIVARFYDGKTLEQIGQELGIHKYTVSLRISKVLGNLKEKLS